MSDNTALGDRMKAYENVTRNVLPRRTYTILRLDGRAFHTWTKDKKKPFDSSVFDNIALTAYELLSQISGSVLAYIQSDEISILITDFANTNTQPWFSSNIQKIVSVSSSIATAHFNEWARTLYGIGHPLAFFDARVFTIPEQPEVMNYFIWRFRDCTRNSIQSLGQHYFSQSELNGKSTLAVREMLVKEKNVDWELFSESFKYGRILFPDGFDSSFNLYLQEDKAKLLQHIPIPNIWTIE